MGATLRQKIAASKISEKVRKGEKVSMGRVLKEAGYSDSVSKHPDRVTRTQGWQELMEEYMPDDKLAELHNQLLNAKKTVFYNKKRYILPDNDIRLRALESGYKIKGRNKPTLVEVNMWKDWTTEELEAYAERGIVPERFKNEELRPAAV